LEGTGLEPPELLELLEPLLAGVVALVDGVLDDELLLPQPVMDAAPIAAERISAQSLGVIECSSSFPAS
jgi:hypothetical protein